MADIVDLSTARSMATPDLLDRVVKFIPLVDETIRSLRPIADRLTSNDWKILRALRDLHAVSRKNWVTRIEAAELAGTGDHDSLNNKTSFQNLKALKLIDAVKNRGTWITEDGTAILASHVASNGRVKTRPLI